MPIQREQFTSEIHSIATRVREENDVGMLLTGIQSTACRDLHVGMLSLAKKAMNQAV